MEKRNTRKLGEILRKVSLHPMVSPSHLKSAFSHCPDGLWMKLPLLRVFLRTSADSARRDDVIMKKLLSTVPVKGRPELASLL